MAADFRLEVGAAATWMLTARMEEAGQCTAGRSKVKGARDLEKGRDGGPAGGDLLRDSADAAGALWSSTPHSEVDLVNHLLSLNVRFISEERRVSMVSLFPGGWHGGHGQGWCAPPPPLPADPMLDWFSRPTTLPSKKGNRFNLVRCSNLHQS
jgi:hypothetical protein